MRKNVSVHVSERRPRAMDVRMRKRLENVPFEVGAGMHVSYFQDDTRVKVLVTNSEGVSLNTRRHQGDFWLEELGDRRSCVQGNGEPYIICRRRIGPVLKKARAALAPSTSKR